MTHRIAATSLLLLAVNAALPSHAAGISAIRSETVRFAKGATTAQIRGSIKGDVGVDYRIDARAGQMLTVAMKTSNESTYFNINPPGSQMAMFVGSTKGTDATVRLPTDGTYVVRVYVMRNASRRNEMASYTLTVGVTGRALPPLPAAQDALIPGTKFHASGEVQCQPPFETKAQRCDAFVIRRGVDGTATVEVRGPNALRRRILFVAGVPVASDATEPLTHAREGDRTVVNLGTDERYEIPDPLVQGG